MIIKPDQKKARDLETKINASWTKDFWMMLGNFQKQVCTLVLGTFVSFYCNRMVDVKMTQTKVPMSTVIKENVIQPRWVVHGCFSTTMKLHDTEEKSMNDKLTILVSRIHLALFKLPAQIHYWAYSNCIQADFRKSGQPKKVWFLNNGFKLHLAIHTSNQISTDVFQFVCSRALSRLQSVFCVTWRRCQKC